ncbi:MAG: tetratricopeptide repeat protein [candidate division Zixibacteria bacterium]|nr:tetratricopeptide repeat protein [candidate division Zixibacteria bacterium]
MKRIIALGILLIISAVFIAGCMPKEIRTVKIELGTRQKPKADPNLDRVKMNLTKAEKNYPNNAEVYYLWGWVHSMEGNYVEMDKAFKKSVEISDAFKIDADTIRMEKWDELIKQADLARQEKDFEKALEAFESCIVCWPYRYEPYMFGGDCAFRIGQLEKAYDMSKKAYEIVPDSLNAAKLYANMCMVNQLFDEAEVVLQKLIDKNPTDANVLYRIGDIYLERGDTTKALEMYNKALEFDSDNPDAWLNVALLNLSLKNFCKAAEKFERYVSLEPSDVDNNFLYLLSTYQCAKTDEELTKLKGNLEKFTMDNPDHCEGWQFLANTYLKLKMKKEAIAANEAFENCQKK